MLARCARCQQTFSTERYGVQRCPHCGGDVLLSEPGAPRAPEGAPPPPPPGWSPPAPPAGPPPAAEQSAPFARRKALGFFASYAETLKRVAVDPGPFFRTVKIGESGSAVLFGVLAITVGSWVSTLYGLAARAGGLNVARWMLLRTQQGRQVDTRVLDLAQRAGAAGVAAQILAAPVVALVLVYLGAAVIHLFLLLFRGAGRGFDATLTPVGYAYGLFLLQVLPICGGLVAPVWTLVVAIVGVGEAQRCGPGRAAAATLVPVALLVCCTCAAGFFAAAGIASLVQGR